jgi:hypothetical protein
MSVYLSTPLPPLGSFFPENPQSTLIPGQFMANSPQFDLDRLGISALKSFGMLVTGIQGGVPQDRVNGSSGDRVIGKSKESDTAAPRVPEARYAYYRRCQKFCRNGNQCKAPAMKGEQICHQHAQQADNERRREQRRRELLSRPGLGFDSFDAIQRTIGAVVNALLSGDIEHKVASRIIMQVQIAIRLQEVATRLQHRTERRKSGHRVIGSSVHQKLKALISRSPDHQIARR